MVLLLTAEELHGLITFKEAIAALEQGCRDWAEDPALCEPRHRVFAPSGVRATVHQGAAPSTNGTGLAIHAELLKFHPDGHQTYSMLGSPVRVSYNSETAELEAIIVGELYSPEFPTTHANFGIATAAASMVGTKLLAKRDTPFVGVLGSGNQARLHLAALAAIRRIQDVKVYSRNPDNAAAFAAETSKALDVRVTPVPGAEEAVAHSDVVICATNSSTPVLEGSWLSPGTHVVSLVTGDSGLQSRGHVREKRRELDDETLRRADVIGTSSVLQVDLDRGADLYDSRERGVFPAERLVDVGHLMRGEHPGRVNDAQITVFKNSALYGSGDQAITRLLIDKARSLGLGTRLDTSPGMSLSGSR